MLNTKKKTKNSSHSPRSPTPPPATTNITTTTTTTSSSSSSSSSSLASSSLASSSTSSLQMTGKDDHLSGLGEEKVLEMIREFRKSMMKHVQDRRYRLKLYEKCFIGSEAVNVMLSLFGSILKTRSDAVQFGRILMERGVFYHVVYDHTFKDDYLFYRFNDHVLADYFFPSGLSSSKTPLNHSVSIGNELIDQNTSIMEHMMKKLQLSPNDKCNQELVNHCHPPQWKNPNPSDDNVYNLVVIGAGVGGLVVAAGSAGLGAKVALIESELMGGDCLNFGCVPSKALLKCAKIAHQCNSKYASQYGIEITGETHINFSKIMERMRKLRAKISYHDSAHRFKNELGVDVFIGKGVFTAKDIIQVGDRVLKFKKAVIATGSRAMIPPIPGLSQCKYLSNVTLFNLTKLPKRFAVLGSGPIGCEMAQAFARFGSTVYLFARSDRILPKDDPDASKIVGQQFEKDGIILCLGVKKYVSISENHLNELEITVKRNDGDEKYVVDQLLVATGRTPNVDGIGLDNVGVKYDTQTGIDVNQYFQTTNSNIYAVGDCCFEYKFTHASDFIARTVIRNALFFGFAKSEDLLIPHATYTMPEVAHVGLHPNQVSEGTKIQTFTKSFSDIDRSILEGETDGFVKIHVKEGTDNIVGATIVHEHAGDLISHIVSLMKANVGLQQLATHIFPYPTVAEAIRKIGDDYNRTRLTHAAKVALETILSIRKKI